MRKCVRECTTNRVQCTFSFYTKHVAYGIMVLIAMTLLRILYLAPRIKRYIKPCYCYKTMQSIDHLNLNKPERERGLKKK